MVYILLLEQRGVGGPESMIQNVRRKNLLALIDERFEGNRAAFCRAAGKNPNLINLILTKNPDHQRSIGEKLCRDIEESMSLPSGWMDQKALMSTDRTVSIPVSSRTAATAEEWLVLEPETVRRLAPEVGRSNIICLKTDSDSMTPTINRGDFVIVDKTVTTVESSGGVYAINDAGSISFVRFRRVLGNGWSMLYDNDKYPERNADEKFIKKLEVIGRAVSVLNYNHL